jgi:hypothetical protein
MDLAADGLAAGLEVAGLGGAAVWAKAAAAAIKKAAARQTEAGWAEACWRVDAAIESVMARSYIGKLHILETSNSGDTRKRGTPWGPAFA